MAERFIKSSTHIRNFIASQTRVTARDCYEFIKKITQHQNPAIVRYPALEAIINAFRPLYEGTVKFQTVKEPTLHKVMPNIQHCITELSRIEHGEEIIREGDTMVRPSLYSMRFWGTLKEKWRRLKSVTYGWSCVFFTHYNVIWTSGWTIQSHRSFRYEQRHYRGQCAWNWMTETFNQMMILYMLPMKYHLDLHHIH